MPFATLLKSIGASLGVISAVEVIPSPPVVTKAPQAAYVNPQMIAADLPQPRFVKGAPVPPQAVRLLAPAFTTTSNLNNGGVVKQVVNTPTLASEPLTKMLPAQVAPQYVPQVNAQTGVDRTTVATTVAKPLPKVKPVSAISTIGLGVGKNLAPPIGIQPYAPQLS